MPQISREPTDQRLLTLAGEHLKRFGRAKLTVVGIAEEAGMTHANVYRYFPSKQALLESVVDAWLKGVERRLVDIADGPDPADDKLERLLMAMARANREIMAEDPELFAVLKSALIKRSAVTRRNRARIRLLIERVVDEGMSTGTFSPRDRDQAIAFVIDAMHRFVHPVSIRVRCRHAGCTSLDLRMATMIRVVLARAWRTGVV